jgi:hypothetical protein
MANEAAAAYIKGCRRPQRLRSPSDQDPMIGSKPELRNLLESVARLNDGHLCLLESFNAQVRDAAHLDNPETISPAAQYIQGNNR